jgi:hypothetical protein
VRISAKTEKLQYNLEIHRPEWFSYVKQIKLCIKQKMYQNCNQRKVQRAVQKHGGYIYKGYGKRDKIWIRHVNLCP